MSVASLLPCVPLWVIILFWALAFVVVVVVLAIPRIRRGARIIKTHRWIEAYDATERTAYYKCGDCNADAREIVEPCPFNPGGWNE